MVTQFQYKYLLQNGSFETKTLVIGETVRCNQFYSVKTDVVNNTNSSNFNFVLQTLTEIKPHVYLSIGLIFDNEEMIVSVNSILPKINFKSFIPDQYEIITNKRRIIVVFKKPYSLDFVQKNNSIEFNIVVDAPFLHPAWDYSKGQRISTAFPIVNEGTAYSINLEVRTFAISDNFIAFKKFPYPEAHKSAFILTDHCDFDTIEKLKLFLLGNNNNGWLNRGLKITKGVFALGIREGEIKRSDSLAEEEYKSLIDKLYVDGSEIVHHALKHSGQVESEDFHNTFKKFAEVYHPKTWIDHGSYIKHCYSQGAKENSDFLLVETMKKFNYNNLWSFDDINLDANQTLNILVQEKKIPIALIKQLFLNLFKGKFLVAGHYFRSIIHRNYSKNIVIDFVIYVMASTKNIFINLQKRKHSFFKDCIYFFQSIFNFHKFRNTQVVPYIEADVLKFAQPLYLEERRPFAQYTSGDLLMFYTFETTHLVDIYNEKSILRLINDNGTHIGHTYILNNLPYINSIFCKKGSQLSLSEKWIEFLDILQHNVEEKNIWNANMGEYTEYNILLLNVVTTYLEDGSFQIENLNEEDVKNFTFINHKSSTKLVYINGVTLHATCSDFNYNYFITTLHSKKRIVVSTKE